MGVMTVGFLGILGTAAGKYLQVQIEKSFQRAKQKEHERAIATEVFENLSFMMDDQLYNIRQVYLGIRHGVSPEVLENRWGWYREILYEWHRKTNVHIALTTQYFGTQMGQQFESQVLAEFRDLKRQVERAYFQNEHINSELFEKQMNELEQIIRLYSRSMLETIQKEKYGIYHPDFFKVSFSVLQALGLGK